MARKIPSSGNSIRRQRRRNLSRHQLRRRKFLQHRQREQRLSLFNPLDEQGEHDIEPPGDQP